MRDNGTHYTHSKRIAILMVRLLTTLGVAALFYGKAKDTTIGDFTLSYEIKIPRQRFTPSFLFCVLLFIFYCFEFLV